MAHSTERCKTPETEKGGGEAVTGQFLHVIEVRLIEIQLES